MEKSSNSSNGNGGDGGKTAAHDVPYREIVGGTGGSSPC